MKECKFAERLFTAHCLNMTALILGSYFPHRSIFLRLFPTIRCHHRHFLSPVCLFTFHVFFGNSLDQHFTIDLRLLTESIHTAFYSLLFRSYFFAYHYMPSYHICNFICCVDFWMQKLFIPGGSSSIHGKIFPF